MSGTPPESWVNESMTHVYPQNSVYPGGQVGSDDLGLRGVLRLLRRRRWSIVIGASVVFGLVAAATTLMPRTYESTVTLLLEERDQGAADALAMLERLGQTGDVDTELGMMKGRSVIEPVVDQMDLHVRVTREGGDEALRGAFVFPVFEAGQNVVGGRYQITPVSGGSSFTVLELEGDTAVAVVPADSVVRIAGISLSIPKPTQQVVMEVTAFARAVSGLQNNVNVGAVGRNAEYVELKCRGEDADELQQVCDAVADSYLRVRASMGQNTAETAADFLLEQSAEVGRQLAAAEDSLRRFQTANQAVALERTAEEGVRAAAQLAAQQMQTEAEHAALSQLIEDIEGSAGEGTRRYRDLASFPTFLQASNEGVSGLMTTLVELENQRSNLALSRSDTNADVVALDSRITEVEGQLLGFASSYQSALGAQLASLDQAMGAAQTTLATIPARQLEQERLGRQVAIKDELYRHLQTRLQEAQVAQAIATPGIRIVDRASLPFEPVSPNVPLNLAVGLLLGFAFGGALALFREDTDSSVKAREDLERLFVPILGTLPGLKKGGPVLPVWVNPDGKSGWAVGAGVQRNGTHMATRAGKKKGRGGGRKNGKRTAEHQIALEAFRSIVTDIRFMENGTPDSKIKTVAITGASRGDGKTFSACNLAIAYANLGVRTLLIDGDVRAKGATRFFGVDPHADGLTEVLRSTKGSLESRLERSVVPMAVAKRVGLSLLPPGNLTDQSAELLGGERFNELLTVAKERYGMVLLDSPPLTLLTDAAQLAAVSDGVLVITREGQTDQKALEVALERLERAEARVLGVVLNGSELPGYYKSYSYVYG